MTAVEGVVVLGVWRHQGGMNYTLIGKTRITVAPADVKTIITHVIPKEER